MKRIIQFLVLLVMTFIIWHVFSIPIQKWYHDPKEYTVEVTANDIFKGNNILVFARDKDGRAKNFLIEDSYMKDQWEEERMESGKVYRVAVSGMRIPFLGEYEKVLWYEEIT